MLLYLIVIYTVFYVSVEINEIEIEIIEWRDWRACVEQRSINHIMWVVVCGDMKKNQGINLMKFWGKVNKVLLILSWFTVIDVWLFKESELYYMYEIEILISFDKVLFEYSTIQLEADASEFTR